MRTLGLLFLAAALSGCAGPGGVRQNGRVVWERSPAPSVSAPRWGSPPVWAATPPADDAFRYFVGEFEGDGSVDEALARAWASGMLRAGVTEFPQVADVEASGEESLHGARFQRRFAVALGAIDWSDLDEARERGSPVVQSDDRTGRWRVFRLLKWRKSAIAAARSKLASAQLTALPPPSSAAFVAPSPKNSPKKWLQAVAAGGRCRGDVDAAVLALGPPDRLAREPERPELRHYFWGAYRLTAKLPDKNIIGVARVLGGQDAFGLCTGSLAHRR